MKTWKTLHRTTAFHHSKWLTVENHTIELPDGKVLHDWPWIISPDYINVVAVTEDGKFLCFRQPKYGYQGISLAPVGGYLEPGEDPLLAAQRELREETGYEAPDWKSLGQYAVDGNHGAGKAHLFLARGAHHVTEPSSDDLEEQELLLLSRGEVEEALRKGEFKVVSWAANVAMALLFAASL